MKAPSGLFYGIPRLSCLAGVWLLISAFFPKQAIAQSSGRKIEGTGNTSSVGIIARSPETQTVTVYITALSEPRIWTNKDGKTMEARLLAYAAPEPGKEGPITVIQEDKVRFLLTGKTKPIDYPFADLSELDQTFIFRIVDATRYDPPPEGKIVSETETKE